MFFLHNPYWNLSHSSSGGEFLLESISYTPVLEIVWLFVGLGVPKRPVLKSITCFGTWGVSLKRPVLDCLLIRQVGSFSYTPRAGIRLVVWRVGSLSVSERESTKPFRCAQQHFDMTNTFQPILCSRP